MGKKSRMKKLRRNLRPQPKRTPQRVNATRSKVMGLLEEMVDKAHEDLRSGADKPRVSYAQAMKAAQLMMQYGEDEEQEVAEAAASPQTEPAAQDETNRWDHPFDEVRPTQVNTE